MWCTSRASADSSRTATRVRSISSTRWWCTAPAASSEDTATRSELAARSEMTTHATPSATAAEASFARRLSARSSPSAPSETAYVASRTRLVQPRWSIALSASICSTVSSGDLSRSLCASVSLVVTRSPSGPTMHSRDVTTASRMGSMGGFVTCANICLKYSKLSLGISDITASGASLPIEPSASAPVPIMGSRIMSSASRVNPEARRGASAPTTPASLVDPLITGRTSGFAFVADSTTSSRSITWFFTHSAYGRFAAISAFMSSSCTTVPFSKSTSRMLPGRRRPFCATSASSMSTTPTSEAMTMRPDFVR